MTARTLGGRVVVGTVDRWSLAPTLQQKPIEELMVYLDAVLDGPWVTAIRWIAFTPESVDPDTVYRYRVEDPAFQFRPDDEFTEYADVAAQAETNADIRPAQVLWRLIRLASAALVDGAFNLAMVENFGINVQVTVTATAIQLELFEPDY